MGRYDKYKLSQNAPETGGKYDKYKKQTEIPKPEALMSKAVNPFQQGLKTAFNTFTQATQIPQIQPMYREAQEMKSKGINQITKNPFGRIGLEIATDPTTYVGGGAASKAPQAAKSIMTGIPKAMEELPVNFATKSGGRKLAMDVFRGMGKAKQSFKKSYKGVIESPVQNFGKPELDEISDVAIKSTVGSPNPSILEKIASDVQGMSPEQLHFFKQKIYKMPEARPVYNKINEVLSRPGVYGSKYKELTRKMDRFINKEQLDVEKLFTEKVGSRRRPTETKILSEAQLSKNQQLALEKFGERSGQPFLKRAKAIKRGEAIKSKIPFIGSRKVQATLQ